MACTSLCFGDASLTGAGKCAASACEHYAKTSRDVYELSRCQQDIDNGRSARRKGMRPANCQRITSGVQISGNETKRYHAKRRRQDRMTDIAPQTMIRLARHTAEQSGMYTQVW